MRRPIVYLAIAAGIALAVLITIASPNLKPVVAQYYVVGGTIEAPQEVKGIDYGTLVVVAGIAAAAILIGLAVASRLRERAE